MKRVIGFLAIGLLASTVRAQAPVFDAASLRPSATGVGAPVGASFDVSAGSWMRATGATLHDLVARAYGVQYFQVVGVDRWISSERFDLNARGPFETTSKNRQLMLRSLLEERFGLRVHSETRNLPVFALVAATRGRTGPRLRRSQRDCREVLEDRDPFEAAHEDPNRPACRQTTRFVVGSGGSEITIVRAGVSMRQLALQLTSFAQRAVLDRTGLEGTYDVELA